MQRTLSSVRHTTPRQNSERQGAAAEPSSVLRTIAIIQVFILPQVVLHYTSLLHLPWRSSIFYVARKSGYDRIVLFSHS